MGDCDGVPQPPICIFIVFGKKENLQKKRKIRNTASRHGFKYFISLVNSVTKEQPCRHAEGPAGANAGGSIHESTPIEGREKKEKKRKKEEEKKRPISCKQSGSLTAETERQISTRPVRNGDCTTTEQLERRGTRPTRLKSITQVVARRRPRGFREPFAPGLVRSSKK